MSSRSEYSTNVRTRTRRVGETFASLLFLLIIQQRRRRRLLLQGQDLSLRSSLLSWESLTRAAATTAAKGPAGRRASEFAPVLFSSVHSLAVSLFPSSFYSSSSPPSSLYSSSRGFLSRLGEKPGGNESREIDGNCRSGKLVGWFGRLMTYRDKGQWRNFVYLRRVCGRGAEKSGKFQRSQRSQRSRREVRSVIQMEEEEEGENRCMCVVPSLLIQKRGDHWVLRLLYQGRSSNLRVLSNNISVVGHSSLVDGGLLQLFVVPPLLLGKRFARVSARNGEMSVGDVLRRDVFLVDGSPLLSAGAF